MGFGGYCREQSYLDVLVCLSQMPLCAYLDVSFPGRELTGTKLHIRKSSLELLPSAAVAALFLDFHHTSEDGDGAVDEGLGGGGVLEEGEDGVAHGVDVRPEVRGPEGVEEGLLGVFRGFEGGVDAVLAGVLVAGLGASLLAWRSDGARRPLQGRGVAGGRGGVVAVVCVVHGRRVARGGGWGEGGGGRVVGG